MSIDKLASDLIAAFHANTEALKALTAAMQSGGSAASAPVAAAETETKATAEVKPTRARKSAAEKGDAYTPKYTQSEMQAAVNEVKNEFGTAEAKRLIKEVGGHDRLADVVDPKAIDALYEAARAKIEEGGEEDDDI